MFKNGVRKFKKIDLFTQKPFDVFHWLFHLFIYLLGPKRGGGGDSGRGSVRLLDILRKLT